MSGGGSNSAYQPVVPFPSGEQHELVHGDHRATLVEVSGGVRAYRVGDRDVLQPYPASAVCDGAHGQPLIPWPNRLEDGSYDFDGVHYSLPLTEPEKSNPIHGLTRWRAWRLQERGGDHALLSCRLFPMPGYPFALDLQVSYRLDETGLTVAIAATNVGERACPYACGQHPSLSAGGGLLDDCLLQFGAKTRVDTDPVRQLPTGTVPVSGSRFDFGTPRRLGSLTIDYAFRDLDRDDEGRAELRLTRPDGSTVAAWWTATSRCSRFTPRAS